MNMLFEINLKHLEPKKMKDFLKNLNLLLVAWFTLFNLIYILN